nr:JAB domain-containing protein [Enterococcus faecalis]
MMATQTILGVLDINKKYKSSTSQSREVGLFVCTKIYHPSGNPTPSPQDIQFTKRMEECGEMMGIQLLDHIIVGDSGYISLREENFFASE